MSMVLKALRKQNMRCDYVALNEIPGQEKQISLSYDARISLLEGDAFLEEKPLAHQQYKPHILIMSDLLWHPTKTHSTFESYVDFWKGMVASIERDGKFIYNQNTSGFGRYGQRGYNSRSLFTTSYCKNRR